MQSIKYHGVLMDRALPTSLQVILEDFVA